MNFNNNRQSSSENSSTDTSENIHGDRLLENNFRYHEFTEYEIPKNFNAQTSNEKINRVVFIVWFMISLGIIMFTFQTSSGVAMTVFGQVLFFGGLGGIRRTTGFIKTILLLLPFSGLLCISVGLMNALNGNETRSESNDVILFLGMLLFIGVGVATIIIPRFSFRRKKERYTIPLSAKVIDIKETSQDTKHSVRTVYIPCYQYRHDNTSYIRIAPPRLSQKDCPPVGSCVDLRIDPYQPEDFCEWQKEKNTVTSLTIIGILLIVLPVIFCTPYLLVLLLS